MKKTCPRCSTSFSCREDRTDLCNCTRIYMVSGVKDYIRETYEGCLCPQCLKDTNSSFHSFGINPKYLINKKP